MAIGVQYGEELKRTARAIAAKGKGILAADESTGTIGSRFDEIKLANNHENRMEYRRLLFTTPGLNQYISGVILFEETLFDKDASGQLLVKPLVDSGIILGIKVDQVSHELGVALTSSRSVLGLSVLICLTCLLLLCPCDSSGHQAPARH
jgi:fructose-bisphosphate aldolase class I